MAREFSTTAPTCSNLGGRRFVVQKACSAFGSEVSFLGMKLSSMTDERDFAAGRRRSGRRKIVVDGVPVFVLVVEAGFIVEDGVEANVFETR